jgi:hypothetical protein
MAMIDYGAIAFKNGKLISTDMFTPMLETCGFSDEDKRLPGSDVCFDGNHFIVLGNRDIVFGFYKTSIHWWRNSSYEPSGGEFFGISDYVGWKYWHNYFYIENEVVEIKVKPRNGYYTSRFSINGDRYKVYFGYGVDFHFYQKTRRVNYYRSPEYFAKHAAWRIVSRAKRLLRNV